MSKRPHILVLMPDQQRADCLSCAGHPVIETPNMDRIAAEGVRFTNAYTTCPLCMPARSSFLSGLYCHNHGQWTNAGRLPEDAETSFNYAGSGGWESTRNLRLSARDGFLPWVIVGSVAPRGLIFGHEFGWDRPRDPVWKRLKGK